MKINDDHFNRLMKAARPSLPQHDADLPFGAQARIMAQWQSQRNVPEFLDLRRLFQIGLACACVLVLIIAAASLRELNRQDPPGIAVHDAVINLALQ